jgi:protein kinase C substrate 80K-H
VYAFEEYLPGPLRDWVDKKLRDFRIMLIENGILASPRRDGKESDAVAGAKKRLKAAQDEVRKTRRELDQHKTDLEAAYGPDDVFRSLKGQCITKEAGEYVYELCWMEGTTQKPKKSGANTGMGRFQRIDWVTVDEDITADGKGLGSGERMALKYENGQHCWNGPSRSTTVIVACAEKDEIWKIAEEEKCVYRMEVGSPAACQASAPKEEGHVRDEL